MVIGNFIDYLIAKMLQINYPKKVKKFDMAHLMDVMAFDLQDLAAGPYMMKIRTFRRNLTQQAVIRFVID